ncbi:hypothetical protein BY458DRAFT_521528 [Sporodiniella umbellata]|nr:hypothetical protein BY458DRAFT_521528 [Sporodiniella umbellata]
MWAGEIEWMVDQAEAKFGVKFPPGYNDRLCCIRLSLDPVEANHRPLIVYIGLYLCTLVFNLVFLQWYSGMTATVCEHSWGGPLALLNPVHQAKTQVGYWSRRTESQKTPIVLMHGLGVGLLGYVEFIHQLLTLADDRPVFIIELPYVSMRLVEHVPTAEETVRDIQQMLYRHGHTQAVFVAHSLGTAVASWISKYAPEIMLGSIMVDPICFLLHHHHVAFNFMHRAPKALMEYFLCYGVSRELHINHYISRHLQWFETIHFADELKNASVFLSENDRIIGSPLVHRFLKERKVDVCLMPGLEHAQFLIDSRWKELILDSVDKISRKADFSRS